MAAHISNAVDDGLAQYRFLVLLSPLHFSATAFVLTWSRLGKEPIIMAKVFGGKAV